MNGTENFVQPLSKNLVVYEPSLALPAPWISEVVSNKELS